MAKDTEKLIRQLSLISYLMAERRPVTAPEIRSQVEGYSGMNEDAFARRFYADRAELESLGIQLAVDKPVDGLAEQENYSLPPENFYLPAIAFTDSELAALQTALSLLDGEFAYAEPLRLALQQISWGRPSPLRAPDQRSVALGITASAGGHDLSQRLVKVDTAISRRKTITFEYYTMERDELGERKVDPYQLLFQGGQFYLVGHAHERDAVRVFRLSRMRGKVAYATKAEHDFQRPEDFDPRVYANRIDWQFGDPVGEAEILVARAHRLAGRAPLRPLRRVPRRRRRRRPCSSRRTPTRARSSPGRWGSARTRASSGPPELVEELDERVGVMVERHTGEFELARPKRGRRRARAAAATNGAPEGDTRREAAIRPERFARLVTLASILIEAGREGERLPAGEVCERLQISDAELREDVNVLNVVNFGAGLLHPLRRGHRRRRDRGRPRRVLGLLRPARAPAADRGQGAGRGDRPDRRAHPQGVARSLRAKIVAALGEDPVEEGLQVASAAGDDSEIAQVVSRAIAGSAGCSSSSTTRRTRTSSPSGRRRALRADERARGLVRRVLRPVARRRAPLPPRPHQARRGHRRALRAAARGRSRRPTSTAGRAPARSRPRAARVWISPERARWAREERTVVAELADGAVIVELAFAGTDWLVREVLKEAGDAAVLEPEDARDAVRTAAERLAGAPGLASAAP